MVPRIRSGLVLTLSLSLLFSSAKSEAEVVKLPPSSVCAVAHDPEGENSEKTVVEVTEYSFLIPRDYLDRANACPVALGKCRQSLIQSEQERAILEDRKESGWLVAAKWMTVSAAIAGAFVIGTTVD